MGIQVFINTWIKMAGKEMEVRCQGIRLEILKLSHEKCDRSFRKVPNGRGSGLGFIGRQVSQSIYNLIIILSLNPFRPLDLSFLVIDLDESVCS